MVFPGINLRGLVSGYRTAIPCLVAARWKKPFSAQLSGVHVKPAKYIKRGKLGGGRWDWVWAGMKRLKFISHFVEEALCANLRSLPPKQAMEPLVRKVIDFVLCHISGSSSSVYMYYGTVDDYCTNRSPVDKVTG